VAGVDDAPAAALLAAAPAPRRVGVTTGVPEPGQLGVVDGVLVDRAFAPRTRGRARRRGRGAAPRARPAPSTPLAAAALARAHGVGADAVRTALTAFRPGRHRAEVVGVHRGVTFVDDSKATNPHAAAASLAAAAGPVVWIAGGLLKGASVDDLVAAQAPRLRAAVVIGRDRGAITAALARHAPDVPAVEVEPGDDGVMTRAVAEAVRLARPGDVVLLAPAAASMDQFRDYAARGDAFAAAVAGVPG
jgi:UDP-N-acetylmuramoylalanine--D-glutamate ligase